MAGATKKDAIGVVAAVAGGEGRLWTCPLLLLIVYSELPERRYFSFEVFTGTMFCPVSPQVMLLPDATVLEQFHRGDITFYFVVS